jgi:hypothetical protein
MIIKDAISKGIYKYLKLQCYVCENNDHISVECPEFKSSGFEGNIKAYFEKTKL